MAGVGDLAGGISQTNFENTGDLSQTMKKLSKNIHLAPLQRSFGTDLKAGKNAMSLVERSFAQLFQ
jgi:hypothetical protein